MSQVICKHSHQREPSETSNNNNADAPLEQTWKEKLRSGQADGEK